MKKILPSFKALITVTVLILAGVNLNAQNICAATNTISPAATQNICIGSPSNQLTTTITTNGSGNNGNITYTWYSNTTNSTIGGTLVQTLSTTTGVTTNSFTPPVSVAGTLWFYCTVTNDGGSCAGTSFTTATVQVNVNDLPKIFNVSGGGARCSNGAGVSISINNTETGVKYQLVRDGGPVGTALSGTTGRPLGFSVTTAGTFTMVATNITTGCSSNMSGNAIVIINPVPIASFTKTDVSCQGGDGSLTVTGSGGTPAYLFNINGGSFSINNNFSGLSAGNYPIAVKDANSCIVNVTGTIAKASPLSVGVNQVNPGDCSGNDGSITVSRVGGVDDGITPVQFKLDGDVTRPYQISNVFGGLSKGNYTITIKDSKGCIAVSSPVSLTQIAGTVPITYNVTGGGTRCGNGAGVSIYLSGSEMGVNYQLQSGGGNVGSVLSGTGRPISFFLNNAGSYTIVATNAAAGCTSNMNGVATIIVNPAPIAFNVTGGGSRCSNGSGVSIYLSSSQVGVNYQLQRDGGSVGTIRSGTGTQLSFVVSIAGTYTMEATNATTNCTMIMNGSAIVITNQAPKVFTVSGGGANCSSNSSVSIKLSGSETGVSYQLNNNGISVGTAIQGSGSPLTFLASATGTYQILASNATFGCTTFMADSAILTQNPALTPSYSKYFASSCVGGDGTITITPSGGTPGYMYSVDNGPFGSNNFLTGLAAGDHEVVIKDANSCTFTYPAITVLTAPIMKVTANSIPVSSCSGNDGSLTGLYYGGVVDGITPLQYKLDGDATRPFQTNNTFNNLSAGNYTITIKDSKGCLSESAVITLGTAAALNLTPASYSTNVSSCGNGNDANIAIGVTGGVAPYHFKLNGSEYGQSNVPSFGFSNLGIGVYTVIVSDLHGCSISQNFTIVQATAPVAKIANNEDETCKGKNNGYISLSPTGIGGIPPAYSYSKDGGTTYQSSYSFTNLSPATYSMVVKDSKGCVSAPVAITVKASTANCVAGRIGNTSDDAIGNPKATANENSSLSKSLLNFPLSIKAYPNPFASEFTLDVKGNSQDKVSLIVTDVLGRRMYQAEGNANQQYKLGNSLGHGIYIVQVMQGNSVQTIKIVKE